MGLHEEIFLRADYEEFFRSLGLLNYDSFLTFERGEEVSEVRDRIVFRFRPEAEGDAFFLKIYRQPGANRPLSQCLQIQRPMTLAKLEAWNLQWLEERGFIAPKVLAWGGRMNGWSEVNSFLVTEEMVGFEPFDEWLVRSKSELPGKEFQRIKRVMIDRCAEALADLHGQGFHHPFPYLRHFFVPVEPLTPSEPLPLTPSPPCGEGELTIPPPRNAGRGLGGGVLKETLCPATQRHSITDR
ncbi:MAG: hypothetical protein KC964_27160 [Candidatus Omnitrophica bacterium]|nr:hypothetical protein [Candidatus Omnitrophota bacterium]